MAIHCRTPRSCKEQEVADYHLLSVSGPIKIYHPTRLYKFADALREFLQSHPFREWLKIVDCLDQVYNKVIQFIEFTTQFSQVLKIRIKSEFGTQFSIEIPLKFPNIYLRSRMKHHTVIHRISEKIHSVANRAHPPRGLKPG